VNGRGVDPNPLSPACPQVKPGGRPHDSLRSSAPARASGGTLLTLTTNDTAGGARDTAGGAAAGRGRDTARDRLAGAGGVDTVGELRQALDTAGELRQAAAAEAAGRKRAEAEAGSLSRRLIEVEEIASLAVARAASMASQVLPSCV